MKKISKVVIVLLIGLGISGVWLLKNYDIFVKEEVNIENVEKQNDQIKDNQEQSEDVQSEILEVGEQVEMLEKQPIADEQMEILKGKQIVEEKIEIDETVIEEIVISEVNEELIQDDGADEIPEQSEIEIDVNDPNFELIATSLDLETLKQYNLPILIDFGAEACIPCQMMYPTLEELNEELRGKAIVKFIDVWQYPEASNGFEFSLIPTQFFFDKEGNQYLEHTGILSKENILVILKEMGMEE